MTWNNDEPVHWPVLLLHREPMMSKGISQIWILQLLYVSLFDLNKVWGLLIDFHYPAVFPFFQMIKTLSIYWIPHLSNIYVNQRKYVILGDKNFPDEYINEQSLSIPHSWVLRLVSNEVNTCHIIKHVTFTRKLTTSCMTSHNKKCFNQQQQNHHTISYHWLVIQYHCQFHI